jgi:hypothetical protein
MIEEFMAFRDAGALAQPVSCSLIFRYKNLQLRLRPHTAHAHSCIKDDLLFEYHCEGCTLAVVRLNKQQHYMTPQIKSTNNLLLLQNDSGLED